MKNIMFMLVALCASFSVMAALDYNDVPPGVFNDGDHPDYDFDYCNREKVEAGQCTLLQRSENGKWITFKTSGGEQCEGGFYGYLNVVEGKGYMVDGEYTCGHPDMKLKILKERTTGEFVYGVYSADQLMGTEPLL